MTVKAAATLNSIQERFGERVFDTAELSDGRVLVALKHGYVEDSLIRITPDGVARYAHPFGVEFSAEEMVKL